MPNQANCRNLLGTAETAMRQIIAVMRHALLGVACSVLAAPAPAAETDVALVISTDWLRQGYSMTEGRAVIQLNADRAVSDSAYLGFWLSTIHLDDARGELNPYVGITRRLGDSFRGELRLSGYLFDDTIGGEVAHYVRAYGMVHFEDILSVVVSATPSAYGTGASAMSAGFTFRRPIADRIELEASLAYEKTRSYIGDDHLGYEIGLVSRHTWGSVAIRYQAFSDAGISRPPRWRYVPTETDTGLVLTLSVAL